MNEPHASLIRQKLNQATLGLENDPELRLEVKTELRSHLEASIEEHLNEGSDQEKATEEALTSLGDTTELTTRFLDANRRRLKLRSWATIILRRILVPVSILAALWVVRNEVSRINLMSMMQGKPHSELVQLFGVDSIQKKRTERLRQTLSEEQQNHILREDDGLKSIERKKILWEAHPKNSALYYDYVIQHLAHHQYLPENAVEESQRIDAGNAFVPLLHAAAALSENVEKEGRLKDDNVKYCIVNRQKHEEALQLLKTAVSLTHLKTRRIPLLQERLAMFPKEEDLPALFARLAFTAGQSLPEILLWQKIDAALSAEARHLADTKDEKKIHELVETWSRTVALMAQGSDFLVSGLVTIAVVNSSGGELLKACHEMKLNDLATGLETKTTATRKLNQDWKSSWGLNTQSKATIPHPNARYGLWGPMIPAGAGQMDVQHDFIASRKLDHLVAERGWVAAFIALMVGLIGICAIAGLRWKFIQRTATPPVFLLLRWRDYARILAGGIICPLALYLIVTRFTPLGGHQWSLSVNASRVSFQLTFLTLLMVILILQITRAIVRQRLRALGEDSIPQLSGWKVKAVPALAVLSLIVSGFIEPYSGKQNLFSSLLSIMGIVPLTIWLLIRIWRGVISWRTNRFYQGSLSRSLIPVFGFAILLLSTLAVSGLNGLEKYWLGVDTVMVKEEGYNISIPEQKSTEWIKGKLLAALSQK